MTIQEAIKSKKWFKLDGHFDGCWMRIGKHGLVEYAEGLRAGIEIYMDAKSILSDFWKVGEIT